MTEPLLPIGAFSRATLLSVKALRNYHEAGILVPASVDPQTGYRAYALSQLTDGAVLRRLRELDLPLEAAKQILLARDPAVTQRILATHQAAMRERLEQAQRIVTELQASVEQPSMHTPVHVRDEPAAHTLAVRGTVPERQFATFLGDAYPSIADAVRSASATPSGPVGALYSAVLQDEEAEPIEAYQPIAAPVTPPPGPVVLSELPAMRVAVLVHAGSYESITETYRALGAWVAQHASWSELPVRESYLISYTETADPADFRTEILWPIVGQVS
ncbi:MerR family transcriptional regulator [Tenggerimyces flavus]|uniref:MerR family transcriptional regulator n=1 Tax=Tenggerimyces flavus TaxID=1708749 RepID=A0ABV7YIU9_9ACTN|nr:GyrI-like domain-containing protein [Tenggerimyces flavus]MBM7787587.1 DNA-binding transcriptional MerR regulator [Tenggerimyces flavus]